MRSRADSSLTWTSGAARLPAPLSSASINTSSDSSEAKASLLSPLKEGEEMKAERRE